MYRWTILFFFVFISLCVNSQKALDTLRYVDLHIQPSFKNYYRNILKPSLMYDEVWKRKNNVSAMNWNGYSHRNSFTDSVGFSGFTGGGSYPQASYDVLQKSQASILLTAFSPFERKLVSHKDVAFRAFGIIPITARRINKKASQLSIKRQAVIYKGAPFEEYKAELQFLAEQNQLMPGYSRRIILIKNRQQLEMAVKNKDIALIPTIEGLSSIYGSENWYWYKHWDCLLYKKNGTVIDSNAACYRELVQNIAQLKQMEYKPFLIAPAHLAWNRVIGQAIAFDSDPDKRKKLSNLARVEKFKKVVFNKHSQGIVRAIYDYGSKRVVRTNDICICDSLTIRGAATIGNQIMKELISEKNGKPILIDMRHMDVQARLDYINMVDELEKKEGRKIPIIISHTAVSGKDARQAKFFGLCPVSDRYDELMNPSVFYEKYDSCLKRLGVKSILFDSTVGWFHPWSINAFNEEIEAVYRTNGILGITLEERVLGTSRQNYTAEYYNRLQYFLEVKGFDTTMIKEFKLAEPLMRNILYIAEHSGFPSQIKSWEHMAIGSDLDGVINPIDICPTAAHIPQLYRTLVKCLPLLAQFVGKTELLCGYEKNIEVLLNKIFYQNGERFILDNYNY